MVVALTIIAVVMLVSLEASGSVVDLSAAALGLLGKQPTGGANQRTARLKTIATAALQSQLEYARQLGWEGECTQASCTWYVPGPAVNCFGTAPASTDPNGAAVIGALASSPVLPADFPVARVVIGWDPATPSYTGLDPTTGQQTTTQYLQDITVDVYHSQADCVSGNAYTSGATAVSIR